MDAPLLNIVLMKKKKIYIYILNIFRKNFLSLVILCMEKKNQIFRIKIDRVKIFFMPKITLGGVLKKKKNIQQTLNI